MDCLWFYLWVQWTYCISLEFFCEWVILYLFFMSKFNFGTYTSHFLHFFDEFNKLLVLFQLLEVIINIVKETSKHQFTNEFLVFIYDINEHHTWKLPVLRYNKIMVIYPYPFLVVFTQFFSWRIFINYCICILTGSSG